MKNTQRGFTLVEILVIFVVASIAGVLLLAILNQSNRLFFNQSSKVTQGINLNDASLQISESIRQTQAIAVSYANGGTTYTTGSSTLVLQIPSTDSAGSSISQTYDYIVITQDMALLRKKIFPDAVSKRSSEDKVLSTRLSSLQFTYLDNSDIVVSPTLATKISYTISLLDKSGSGNQQTNGSGTVILRNN